MAERDRIVIVAKAKAASLPLNRFIVAAALGADYRPPPDRELATALLALNRELSAQGNNLNQIARQLNAGATATNHETRFAELAISLLRTHGEIRQVLTRGREDYGP